MGYRQVLWYFFPTFKPIARFPRRIAIDEFDYKNSDELALIEFGLARTPKEARLLLDRYPEYDHVLDLIEHLDKKRSGFFWRRLQQLLMRIHGSTSVDPISVMKKDRRNFYSVRYIDLNEKTK